MFPIVYMVIRFWQIVLTGVFTVGLFFYYLYVLGNILNGDIDSKLELLIALIPFGLWIFEIVKEIKNI